MNQIQMNQKEKIIKKSAKMDCNADSFAKTGAIFSMMSQPSQNSNILSLVSLASDGLTQGPLPVMDSTIVLPQIKLRCAMMAADVTEENRAGIATTLQSTIKWISTKGAPTGDYRNK